MSENYCVTVKDIYGAPLSDLRAPEGWEFTGEFRPPLRGEFYKNSCWVLSCNEDKKSSPSLILRKVYTVEDIYGEPLHMLTPSEGYEFTGEFRVPVEGDTWFNRYSIGRYTPSKWAGPADSKDGPRLIMKKAPTVESVYGGQSIEKLRTTVQEFEGFKWTGEFRKVKDGDYILGAAGGYLVCPVINRPDLIGQWRLILERVPTIKEIYGKELKDLRAPDGWRFTGEFRNPTGQDSFLARGLTLVVEPPYSGCSKISVGPRLILEKIPATPTIREVYGVDDPVLPKGWKFKEFRQVRKGEQIYFMGHPDSENGYKLCWAVYQVELDNDWRIVVERYPNDPRLIREMTYTPSSVTVEDAYGYIPKIPDGWTVVDFRVPGEEYFIPTVGLGPAMGSYGHTTPRLIVRPDAPR